MKCIDEFGTTKRTNYGLSLAVGAALLAIASPLFAEVEVVLKSGTSLVGDVTIAGTEAVVKIDGAELRVPLAEIHSIASVKSGPDRQAHRLLLTALESRMSNEEGVEVIGLLAEAARLAPDDPHVAYWYAQSLVDAGYGQAANDVLQRQREAIVKQYPGMVDHLAAQIKKRIAMETMPAVLVERIDNLNTELARQSLAADQQNVAAVFRLLDQHKQPIERSAFVIYSDNGQDENLEVFDEGYYLYTFKRHRTNTQHPINVEIAHPGLEAKTIPIEPATNRVQNAGELIVQRYEESAKTAFRLNVVDPEKQPVVGARVTLQPVSSRGGTQSQPQSAETNAEGWAEFRVFPMAYSYNVAAEGFHGTGGRAEVKAGDKTEQSQQMYRAIRAAFRVAWELSNPQTGDNTTGETTVQFGSSEPQPNVYGVNATGWLRPFQHQDVLSVQFNDTFFGYGPFGQAPEPWVRVIEPRAADEKAPEQPAAPVEQPEPEPAIAGEKPGEEATDPGLAAFDALAFDAIPALKDKLRQPRMGAGGQPTGPRPPMVLPVEEGKIYVGKVQHRDERGQPVQVTFKVYVEDVSTAGDAAN